MALELHNLANVERRAGNLREAMALFTESLMILRDMNSNPHTASGLSGASSAFSFKHDDFRRIILLAPGL